MDNSNSSKRLKLSNGAAVKESQGSSGAANLPAYQPPAAIGAQRVRGANSPSTTRPSASIARPANGKTSLRLTVKAAPSKLRQATSGSQIAAPIPPNPYADNASESDATPAPAARTARSTRNPRTVVEPESEEEEDEEEDEEEEEQDEEDDVEDEIRVQDPEDDDQELEDAEDSEEDAEGEEDEDEDMEDAEDEHPPPPIIRMTNPQGKSKPNVTVTAPSEGPLQSVEDKEMEDDEDEELSELDSNENDEEDEEDDSDSDDDEDGSRAATPDLSKLTRRQRGLFEEEADAGLLSLSNEAQKKKHLTAEEHAMRRAEMARRRKNLSEKRNEEEKMDTINKLLKKPAPKRRTRAEMIAAQQAEYMATPGAEDGEEERADPLFVRYINNRHGSRIGVPDEWMELDGSLGDVLRVGWNGGGGKMVEEVA